MKKLALARNLRANATDAERKLWRLLRHRQLANARFRRQQPIGPYIVDFFCPAAKLIVELDGGQHNTQEGLRRDADRSEFLAARGYRVVRFWNHEVLKSPETVLDVLWGLLSPPHPVREGEPASPSRGEAKMREAKS